VQDFDTIIGGGGFAGLSLALALVQNAPAGFRVALVDPAPESAGSKDRRASALSAASRNLLTAIGVWPAVAAQAQPIESIEITDSPLNAALRPHLLGFKTALGGGEPSAFVIENAPLLQALAEAVAAEARIVRSQPDSVQGIEADAFAITATLAGGDEPRARLLVAADGRKSRLRERAGIKCVGWSYPQIGMVTTVAHAKPHGGRAIQHFLPEGPFAILPLTGNRSSIVWSEDTERGEAIMRAEDPEFLLELGKRFGPKLGEIALAGPRQSFPLEMHLARRYAADRLALIGDAAHGVHPLAGQGLNIAFRDVAALAETLVEGARLGLDPGSPVVLERYERWRRFDSAFSAVTMDGLNRLFSNDNAPLRALRDLGLGLVERAPSLKGFFVKEAAGLSGAVPRLLKGEAL
jgi:2-octaprenyl-6-methoxyphenol hydroxylase